MYMRQIEPKTLNLKPASCTCQDWAANFFFCENFKFRPQSICHIDCGRNLKFSWKNFFAARSWHVHEAGEASILNKAVCSVTCDIVPQFSICFLIFLKVVPRRDWPVSNWNSSIAVRSVTCDIRSVTYDRRATYKRKTFRSEQYPFRVHVGFSETVWHQCEKDVGKNSKFFYRWIAGDFSLVLLLCDCKMCYTFFSLAESFSISYRPWYRSG